MTSSTPRSTARAASTALPICAHTATPASLKDRTNSAEGVTQFGATAQALTGDIVLLDTDAPFEFALEGVCDVACLTIPEASLRTRLGRTGRPRSPVVVSRAGAGKLASAYLRACVELERTELAQIAEIAFDQVCALIALADYGDNRDVSTRGRPVTLAAVLALIERHLNDPTLTSASAARALGCSRSLLFSLLTEAGLTFAGYIRARRLSEIARAIVASDAPLGGRAILGLR